MTASLLSPVASGAVLDEIPFCALRAGLQGEVILPGDAAYDAARRVWNGMIDRYPAVIVRCADPLDVVQAVVFARDQGLPLAVRGGGHNVAGFGTCDGGIVVDLSSMRRVEVDPSARLARAEAGCLLSDLDRATQAHGLAVPAGQISHTGIAGLTLGGGLGWLMRKHGLTIDNLLAVEIVTASGRLLRASADENPDLFWAVRGGGGNFGVVVSFEYRLHPVGPEVLAGLIVHPLERAAEVMRFCRDFMAGAPDALALSALVISVPPAPPFPEALWDRRVFAVAPAYAGDLADGERLLAPLRAFGTPALDLVGPVSYVALQSMSDAMVPHGLHYWEKAGYLRTLDGDVIAAFLAQGADATSPMSILQLSWMGGALARVPAAATAFAHRDAGLFFTAAATWTPDDVAPQRHIDWARGVGAALAAFATGGVYVNTLVDEGSARVRAAYPPATYDRLAAVKAEYDPGNLFRLNQNIPPAV